MSNPSTSDSRRTGILLALLAVAAVIVALDYATGGPAAADEAGPEETPYISETRLLARTEAVVESATEWTEAAAQAEAAWNERRARAIAAPSAEIAAARLRSLIEPLLADEGLALTASETLPPRDASDGAVTVVGLSLSIEGADAESVFRFIDRLEHLPDAALVIDALALRGPGRLGGAPRIQATLRTRAVAVVANGGARG